MTTTNAILPAGAGEIEVTANGVHMRTVAQVAAFATLMNNAGMLPVGVTPAGAVVACLAGAHLGLDPFQSVQGIAVVNGRPCLWGDAMIAVVKGSGLVEDEKTEFFPDRKNCEGIRYTVKRRGIPTPYVGTFTRRDAEQAGLWGKKGPWSTNPVRMMMQRARAFALRDGFADVLKGISIAEEQRDIIDAETVDAPKSAPELPAKAKKRATAASLLAASPASLAVPETEPREAVEAVEAAEVQAEAASADFLE